VLGPLLRYVGETEATVWVETDRACQVEVLGHQARTFEVAGHHYGLLVVDGLRPGTRYEYQVALDGIVRWPEPDSQFGPGVLRTVDPDRPLRLVFGSCRIAELPPPPRRRPRPRREQRLRREQEDKAEHGPDALCALAMDLRGQPADSWPDVLLLIGDQVYADEVGPATREFIEQRRDPSKPPGYQIADFTEYCHLYREAWSEPSVRWLLSAISTAMIFDDHDVHDDWNISSSWLRDFQAKPWWQARIRGAYMSYWIYQHLGNLSPDELTKDDLWRQVRAQEGDAAAVLADFADRAARQAAPRQAAPQDAASRDAASRDAAPRDAAPRQAAPRDAASRDAAPRDAASRDAASRRTEDIRWSFRRTFGRVRVVVIDSRGGRVLDGQRRMVSEAEWRWITESASGDWDHLVLATSLPLLLPRGIHNLEAWNEAVCAGAWGKRLARAGERVRQAADLEHWAAFGTSFTEFERLLTGLTEGAYGPPPASITVASGDIHHSYLAAVDFPAGTDARSVVYQAVCSPIHNVLPERFRHAQQLITSRGGQLASGVLARLAGVKKPRLRWRITRGPWFYNMVCAMEFDGRKARIRLERAAADTDRPPGLQPVCETGVS
jgi:hypothetical protein